MRPTRLSDADMAAYVQHGYWRNEVMTGIFSGYARRCPGALACRDETRSYTWAEAERASSQLAASLVRLGLRRDERVLVQMPSDCREFILRTALKKAGLIGAYVAVQWREIELGYTLERLTPAAVVMPQAFKDLDADGLLERIAGQASSVRHRIAIDKPAGNNWLSFDAMCDEPLSEEFRAVIDSSAFRYDEVSLVTTSSGTSGPAKLCEWPEAAQIHIGHGIAGRLQLTGDDRVGLFAPMSGAAGVLLWVACAEAPFPLIFPGSFDAHDLLSLVEREGITVITTVPAILARLAQAPLETYDLSSLRAIRVGTAAMGLELARSVEKRTGCRVIPAAGSMECPGFGHASVGEPFDLRLNGSVGLPLPGCRLRIEDEDGQEVTPGQVGHLNVNAPFASSGYWCDPEATAAAWSDTREGGWYATGDMALVEEDGRLRMVGRRKETINRSGHKILPLELEHVISRHPDVLECAVVGAPDDKYGEVPWAFILLRAGQGCDARVLSAFIRAQGVATYKVPSRFIEVKEFPRVSGNKIDKRSLLIDALRTDGTVQTESGR